MLVGSLNLEGIKMSKSLGNTMTINEALERWRPEAIRTFILSSHYSSPIDLSENAVNAAYKGWQRLWSAVSLVREKSRSADPGQAEDDVLALLDEHKKDFLVQMNDDFNAPAALATLQELTRKVNTLLNQDRALNQSTLRAIDAIYNELGGDILGIIPPETTSVELNPQREVGLIKLLIELRKKARDNRDWAAADRIRANLLELGVVLEDRPDGTIWRLD